MSEVPHNLRTVTNTDFPALPDALPPGRLVHAAEDLPNRPQRPLLWMSDEPVEGVAAEWTRLRAEHERTGLYPVLLEHDPDRGWDDRWYLADNTGDLDVDPSSALRTLWDQLQEDREPEEDDEDEIPEEEWPTGPWPGLARAGAGDDSPEAMADEFAVYLQGSEDVHGRTRRWRLGLIPADDGADALTLAGWDGPCNHTNAIELISAVLRTWGERFGTRVVGLGPDMLWLSVARPPQDLDHARAVALEHFAFCPDNLWQSDNNTVDKYASSLIGVNLWTFWWD